MAIIARSFEHMVTLKIHPQSPTVWFHKGECDDQQVFLQVVTQAQWKETTQQTSLKQKMRTHSRVLKTVLKSTPLLSGIREGL